MYKFDFYNPVKVLFGQGRINELGEYASQYGNNALIVTTKGIPEKIINNCKDILEKSGMKVYIFDGVKSNPKLTSVIEGAQICKLNKIDIVIGLGGGSAIDCSKAIAVVAMDDGNPWDFYTLKRVPNTALPIGAVTTLAATGSEMDKTSIITNEDTQQKFGLHREIMFPKFAIIDPELQRDAPIKHVVYGAFDIISHVLENYFQKNYNPISERFTESITITVMENTEKILINPDDIEARSALCWSAALAMSSIVEMGRLPHNWDAHIIEHEISAKYDIPHGAGLSIVHPVWMRIQMKKTPEKYAQFAHRVFGISTSKPTEEAALEGISFLREWARSVGCPITLSEMGIGKDKIDKIVEDVINNPEGSKLNKAEVKELLMQCYDK